MDVYSRNIVEKSGGNVVVGVRAVAEQLAREEVGRGGAEHEGEGVLRAYCVEPLSGCQGGDIHRTLVIYNAAPVVAV